MKEKLEQLIPKGNLDVYHHLRKIPLDYGPNESLLSGYKLYLEIRDLLDTMKNRKFIPKLDHDFICVRLWDSLTQNFPTIKVLANNKFLKKRGNQRDWSTTLFIFLTVSDLKAYTGKPHYEAVAEHLKTLHICTKKNELYTAKAVEDIFKGIERDNIIQFLLALVHIHEYDNKELIREELLLKYDKKGFLGPGCCVLELSNLT